MLKLLGFLALALTLPTPSSSAAVEIRFGTAPVCEVLRQEVEHDWPVLRGTAAAPQLSKIEWRASDAAQSLPPELAGVEESKLDFDNDGTPDRVFTQGFADHYMNGSVVLMQRGPKLQDSWFLPCQLDAKPIPLEKCPPFSQDFDEAGFSMPVGASKKIFFRGRYTNLTPFRFSDTTYVAVEGSSEDTRGYVGVIKPIAGKKFQPVCLLGLIAKRRR